MYTKDINMGNNISSDCVINRCFEHDAEKVFHGLIYQPMFRLVNFFISKSLIFCAGNKTLITRTVFSEENLCPPPV